MSGLPVAPPPPPPKSRPGGQDYARAFNIGGSGGVESIERGFDRGPHTPTSQFSGTGRLGSTPPTMPGPGFPGAPDQGPGFPSPGSPDQPRSRPGSGLSALRQQQQQSLSEQVKAGTDRANKPPPPSRSPGGSGPGSRTGSRTTSPRMAPPPPQAAPPAYSRPKSRPTSASKAPPSTPPLPAGGEP